MPATGKAQPFRTGRRHSRKSILLFHKQPRQFTDTREMVIVVFGLKEYHINQPHRGIQARMKRRARKHFRRKSVKTLSHSRPSIAKCAQD
jgi:hypothetical protein